MAHQPVGAGFSFATSNSSAGQAFTVQSDTLRVVAKGAGQHVAIGTTGPATTTDYYVPAGGSATLNLGRVSSIPIEGIEKGAATVITLAEGMGNPFKVNDVVVISGITGVTGFNTTAKVVSIDASANSYGYHSERITTDHDSRSLNSDNAVVTAGENHTHRFVKAILNAVEYTPQSTHTWVSGKTDCVKHYPDSAHQFVRAASGGIQKQNGTITVNVGVSPTASGVVTRTISNATYDPSTGVLLIQMPDSSIPAGFGQNATSRVAFQLGGIVFSCAYSGGGNDESPKIFDQNVGKSFEITSFSSSVGVTSISMNVGVAGSNTDPHTFVSGSAILITDYVAMSSPYPKFEDWSILIDDGNGSTCNNVDSSINTSFELLDDILEYSVSPSTGTEPGSTTETFGTLYDTSQILTYPSSFIYDADNVRMSIRGDFDDFPIVEASPYTQTVSYTHLTLPTKRIV